jgi:dihydroxy-acid dehydratase
LTVTAQNLHFSRMSSQTTQGGFAILHGTLAPEGCVARLDGFTDEAFDGPARVFSSIADAIDGIHSGRVRACDIVIIRHDDTLDAIFATDDMGAVSVALADRGLERVTLITDGRAGNASGAEPKEKTGIIGNVAPSAAAGGPIAYVNDDDIIHIDIAGRRIDVMADIAIRQVGRRKKASFAPADRYAAMFSNPSQS